jgi:Transposase DDE domain
MVADAATWPRTEFADFCLGMYVLVDELWARVGPWYRRPGPAPACSDSELLTMVLVGECRGWDLETEAVACWGEHRDLFPVVPERSRFNRRRRALMPALNDVRRVALAQLDLAADRQCAIDSLPVPVMHFHLVPSSPATSDWRATGATFGKVPAKKQTIFGYKLHLLVTLGGVILDFELAPANVTDLVAGAELLAPHRDLLVLGDKGYISAPVAATLRDTAGVTLFTLPRADQRAQLPPAAVALHARWRQIIETVNQQLSEHLRVEENHAKRCWGLCARLYAKLTAHTVCALLNRTAGAPDVLSLKHLAFPI